VTGRFIYKNRWDKLSLCAPEALKVGIRFSEAPHTDPRVYRLLFYTWRDELIIHFRLAADTVVALCMRIKPSDL